MKKTLRIKPEDWQWYGHAAHFCCGRWCRFHLATKVGPWLVSTVGDYVHPRHGMGSEIEEGKWYQKNPWGEDIGFGRKFETMVFAISGECDCGCGLPSQSGSEQDFEGANTPTEARAAHMRLCKKWAGKAQ